MLSIRFIRQLANDLLFNRPSFVRDFGGARILGRLNVCFRARLRDGYCQTALRQASSSSSARWNARQSNDHFAREARVQGLKSRAAFKLLQINDKYRLFRKGNTVVDLGYAPGSWTQVAVNRTSPGGRVVGVDILPAQPPRGASTIQGNFLSHEVQAEVRAYLSDSARGRPRKPVAILSNEEEQEAEEEEEESSDRNIQLDEPGYIDIERMSDSDHNLQDSANEGSQDAETMEMKLSRRQREDEEGKVVDVVLSDMSEPWEQTTGYSKRSISDPYIRMMNTSGIAFKDHAGSMDLCNAALSFGYDTLRCGGHLVCKFYQGSEDKMLEKRLKRLFEKVHREKPQASRSESREGYFIALRRKEGPSKEEVFAE